MKTRHATRLEGRPGLPDGGRRCEWGQSRVEAASPPSSLARSGRYRHSSLMWLAALPVHAYLAVGTPERARPSRCGPVEDVGWLVCRAKA